MHIRALVFLLATHFIFLSFLPAMAASPVPRTSHTPTYLEEPYQVDDPRLETIIDRLIQAIRDLLHGDFSAIRRIWHAIHDLFRILWEYLFAIDQQVKSSQCRDRACTQTGGP